MWNANAPADDEEENSEEPLSHLVEKLDAALFGLVEDRNARPRDRLAQEYGSSFVIACQHPAETLGSVLRPTVRRHTSG